MAGGASDIRIETAFQYGPRIVVITSKEVDEMPDDVLNAMGVPRATVALELAPEVLPDEA
jgi:hypothetical protein